MRGPWGPKTNILYFVIVRMCKPNCYSSIPCCVGLKNLGFGDYDKIKSDIAHFEASSVNLGLFGILKVHKGPLRTPNRYVSVCICSPSWYLLIPSHLRLNPSRF
jgi:hypothetical protein